MEEDKKNSKGAMEKVQDAADTAQDVANAAKDGVNLGKNVATGNYLGVAKDALNLLKNKTVRRQILITSIASILVPIIILLLIAGIFMAVISGIGDGVSDVINSMGQFFSSVGNWFQALFDDSKGKYIITIDNQKFEEIKNSIVSQGIDVEASNLTDECLKLFIIAQYKTQYPEDVRIKIEISEEEKNEIEARGRTVDEEDGKYYLQTDGCIKLYRPEFCSGELHYAKEEDLQGKDFDEIKDKYTINAGGNLIIPQKTLVTTYKGTDKINPNGLLDLSKEEGNDVWENFKNDSTTTKNDTPTTTLSDPIPYQSEISTYTMPFEFLTILTTFTQNSEYGVAVAELVDDNSEITLNILDNSTTDEERYIHQYMSNTRVKYNIGAKAYLPIYSALWRRIYRKHKKLLCI